MPPSPHLSIRSCSGLSLSPRIVCWLDDGEGSGIYESDLWNRGSAEVQDVWYLVSSYFLFNDFNRRLLWGIETKAVCVTLCWTEFWVRFRVYFLFVGRFWWRGSRAALILGFVGKDDGAGGCSAKAWFSLMYRLTHTHTHSVQGMILLSGSPEGKQIYFAVIIYEFILSAFYKTYSYATQKPLFPSWDEIQIWVFFWSSSYLSEAF